MLVVIKSIHTLVWLFFNIVLGVMFYEVISGHTTVLFWIGFWLIVAECLLLVLNKWQCPLTKVARKYSDSTKENFDIYLPIWVARYNKEIYSSLFALLWIIYFFKGI